MTHRRNIITFILAPVLLSGCMSVKCLTNECQLKGQGSAKVEALKKAPEITVQNRLDLSKYQERIDFMIFDDPAKGENKMVSMSFEDFILLREMLGKISNHIRLQRQQLQEIKKFYETTLEGKDKEKE